MKKKYKFYPKILFITGLPSSGKTTLALSLKKKLKKMGLKNIKYIDGDKFREKFKLNRYDSSSRNSVGNKKIKLSNSFLIKKKLVIVTGIAHDKNWRKKIKKKNVDLIEIFTKCPLRICKIRDYKKNYSKAINKEIKNFVGINYKYQEGKSVDINLNMYRNSIDSNAKKIIRYLKKKKYVYRKQV